MKSVLSGIALAAALCVAVPASAQGFTDAFNVGIKEPKGFLRNKHASETVLREQTYWKLMERGIFPVEKSQIQISDVVSKTNKEFTWTAGYAPKKILLSCKQTNQGMQITDCSDKPQPVETAQMTSAPTKTTK